MLLTDILSQSAAAYADKPAFTMHIGYRSITLSYGDAFALSHQVSVFLRNKGVRPGEKIVILSPNTPYWACVLWGCMIGGYVPVPLNTQSTGEMIEAIVAETGARIIFVHRRNHEPLPSTLTHYGIDNLDELVVGDVTPQNHATTHSAHREDTALLLFTSGTTGIPKGVPLSHKNLVANLLTLSSIIPVSSKDVYLSILPLSHVFELMAGLLMPLYRGAHIVYAHAPSAIMTLLAKYRVTKVVAVPEFLRVVMSRIESAAAEHGHARLLQLLFRYAAATKSMKIRRLLFRSVHKKIGGRLGTVASGGAPLDPVLEEKWRALGVVVLQGYGLTETSPVISLNTYEKSRVGSVGAALPGLTVVVASDGEILVKGDSVTAGYYENQSATSEAFTAEGYFKTGDLGHFDDYGFLYISGRKKYMILGPGGQNVYPEDIEAVLNRERGITDSCVLGLAKPNGSIEVHAVLLLTRNEEEHGTNEDVAGKAVAGANAHLASYQKISRWTLWDGDDFPRSATRKVKKEEIRSRLEERSDGSKVSVVPSVTRPLNRLIANITGTQAESIADDTKLVLDLQLDSLLRIELASRIEEMFRVHIDEASISDTTTVRELAQMIRDARPAALPPAVPSWPRSGAASAFRSVSRPLFTAPLTRLAARIRILGLERISDLSLPAIFMPNHLSFLDSAVVITALPHRIRKRLTFAAAQDLVYDKLKSIAWLSDLFFNSFPFPRRAGGNIQAGLSAMGLMLDKGWSVVFYPEGGISSTGILQPLKPGAGLVAVEMRAWVVPVKIIGTGEIMPKGMVFQKLRGEVSIRFGEPIRFRRSASYASAAATIEQALRNL